MTGARDDRWTASINHRRDDLRREPPAEDAAHEHEEEPATVEAGERDDVDHSEVHREDTDELQERRDPELRDLAGDPEDLDRSADGRGAGARATRAAQELPRQLRDLPHDLAGQRHRLTERLGHRDRDRRLDLFQLRAERPLARWWIGSGSRADLR